MLEVKDLQLEKKKAEDNVQWQPSEEESKLLSRLQQELDMATRFRSTYEDQFQENIERYLAKPFYYEDGRAGVVLPIAKWIIESKQATESKSPPSWAYEPAEYVEDTPIAQIYNDVIKNHVWNLKYVNLDYKLDLLNQDKDILGYMYQFVGWRKVYRTIRTMKIKSAMKDPVRLRDDQADENADTSARTQTLSILQEKNENESMTETSEAQWEDEQVLYYDDVCVDNIYPQDCWLHPLALSVADSPWIKIRKRFDYATFLETFSDTNMFKNVDKVRKGKWSMATTDNPQIYKEFYTDEKDQVVVFEHWNVMRDELVIVANGVIIFDGPNPFDHKELPFVDYLDRQQFNTYVGEGEPQRIATISDAINKFLNLAIDKETLAASGINLLDDNLSDFDDVGTLFDPRSAARVSNPKDTFVHYDTPGMSGTTDRMISMLMDYLIFATGVDFRQITDMNASTQATVAAIRREITQGRLNLNVKRNENRGYKRLGWLLAETVRQFYPIPIEGGEDGKKIKYRRIKVTGKEIQEKPTGKNEMGEPIYTSASLRHKGIGKDKMGIFEARPAYFKTRGRLEVRVVGESTFAASRELEKANAKDYIQVATSVMETKPGGPGQPPTPSPILSTRYGVKRYVQAMGYDEKQAFDLEDDQNDKTAKDEASKIMGGAMDMSPPQPTLNSALPPEESPKKLVGVNSEPVQQLKADLAMSNNINQ